MGYLYKGRWWTTPSVSSLIQQSRCLNECGAPCNSSQSIRNTSRFRPIAVRIETKVAGNEADATTQLSVWVVAHFKRLQVIIQRSGVCSEMTVLPLINVQGHQWYITLAVQGESKTVRPSFLLFPYETNFTQDTIWRGPDRSNEFNPRNL